ncbi:unnamed protein product [Ilex paraguariensis]|uniref:Uncharacterized protein n=1 Tax=Ilex paraguariensis TaxID=185542 RepID=A0ABC8TJT6_9AQUA
MESELQRPHGHNYDEDPHNAGSYSVIDQGGDEQHQEKKSVLEKVKAKAKKIKDTLAKHGHGHDHEHDEEEEDEEMVEGPKAHAFGSVAGGKSGVPGQGVVNLEKPTGTVEDRHDSKMVDARPRGNLVHSQGDQYMGQPRVNIGRETGMEEDPHASKDRNDTSFPPNYQTKVADPTNARNATGNAGKEMLLTRLGREEDLRNPAND